MHKGMKKQAVSRYSRCLEIARANKSYKPAADKSVVFGWNSVLCFILIVNAIIEGLHTQKTMVCLSIAM